jgi:Flp pilus assembly CpaE family ATPase
VKTALSLQPFAILSNDYDAMQAALLDGKPAPPGSRFAVSVQALCRQLTSKSAPERKNGSWLASLLHRK